MKNRIECLRLNSRVGLPPLSFCKHWLCHLNARFAGGEKHNTPNLSVSEQWMPPRNSSVAHKSNKQEEQIIGATPTSNDAVPINSPTDSHARASYSPHRTYKDYRSPILRHRIEKAKKLLQYCRLKPTNHKNVKSPPS